MQSLEFYREEFLKYLEMNKGQREPRNLYDPISYILNLGGKRLRPVLVLMSTELFGTDYKKALDAAMAIEVFHNFSLVHDDIMDAAPLRRGKPTVHEKWDVNTGILSGDAMLIASYQFLESYESAVLHQLFQLFNTTAIGVCEGQQLDMDFETRKDVQVAEYLQMIELKTSILIAAALKMGGIIAKTGPKNQDLIYEFGRNLGIAFQLQDDYLDAFGDPETFGKQIGGDIIENKKTYLYLKALENGTKAEQKQLLDLFSVQPRDRGDKIKAVKELFNCTAAVTETSKAIEGYTLKAFAALDKTEVDAVRKQGLIAFGENLMKRTV